MGWVRPFVIRLKEKERDIEPFLVIPPCQYASGREKEIAENFPEIKFVLGPRDYLKYVFWGRFCSPFPREIGRGVCVFLGGDPFHAVLISRRLKVPAVAYLQNPRWRKRFEKFLVRDEKVKRKNFIERGVSPEKVIVVGDLMVDSILYQVKNEEISENLSFTKGFVSIMPGSRSSIACNMTYFFLKTCEFIMEEIPDIGFSLILSPFLKIDDFFNLEKAKIKKEVGPLKVELTGKEGRWQLLTSKGLKVDIVERERYHVMKLSTLALTIPGTNTAQLACLGVPMVVTVPLSMPEYIPLDGFAGIVGNFPFIGKVVKRKIVEKYNKAIKFCAIPNMHAGREIVPEMRGKITPEDVAKVAVELLKDRKRLSRTSFELKKIMGEGGAADKVSDVILEMLKKREG